MKKAFLILSLLAFISSVSTQIAWLSLEEGGAVKAPEMEFRDNGVDGIYINYKLHGIFTFDKSVEDIHYQLIEIPGFGTLTEMGKPALPMRNYPIAVPLGARVNLEITSYDYKTFRGYLIHPALEPLPDNGKNESAFVIDKDFYSKDLFYPESVVAVDSIKIMRGFQFTYIRLCPVQYNPAKKELRVYSNIEARITFSGGSDFVNLKQYSEHFAKVFRNFVVNNTRIRNPGILYKAVDNDKIDTAVVIITDSTFLEAAKKLGAWSTRKGYKSIIKTVNEIGNTSSSIKQYVHDIYQNSLTKPEYLLLIGDDDYVVSERFPGSTVSDLRYVCMDRNYDIYPEMAYGRISVASKSNANKVIEKIIRYETTPPSDTDFYSKGLSVGYFQDVDRNGYADRRFAQTSEEQRIHLNGLGYSFEMCYFAEDPVEPAHWNDGTYSWGEEIPDYLKKPNYLWDGNADQISSAINRGCFLVCHRDHGSVSSWGHPYYSISSINDLHNDDKLPVVFSINCLTGSFQKPVCFCEAFLRNEKGGCVGIVGATDVSYSGYNDAFSEGMIDAIWPGLVPKFPHNPNPTVTPHEPIYEMGYIIIQGKLRMEETWGNSSHIHRVFHYFGDPSMEIYTNVPNEFEYASVVNNGSSITVNAGTPEATICVSSGNNGSDYHKRVENVWGYTFNTSVRPLYITITKHNYIPYTAVTGGTFTSNERWFGNMHVLGNVIFDGSSTLEVLPGAKINFNGSYEVGIKSGSRLIANGTSTEPITLTSSSSNPSPGSWYGIVVEDGGEIELNHARVEYAAYGVKSSYADVELKDSEFMRNKWGCRLYHSDGAVIDNCVFSDNYYYGALLSYSSNVNIEDSEFKNTSLYHGLYLNKSTVRIADSRIEGNHGDGIKVYNQGNLDMSTMYEKGMEEVNNVISNNGIYGIYISYNSTANLGTYLDIVTDILGGFNHFSHISGNYDVYNNTAATIKAEVNWWDDMNIFGNVDYTPTAEDLGYHLSKGLANTGEDEKVRKLLLEAYRLEYVDSSYAEAIRKLDEVVDFVYDSDYSYEVVSSYVRLYSKLGDMEGLEEKLRGLHDRYGSSVIGLASCSYLVTVLSGMRRFEEAVGVCDDVIGIYDRLGGHEEEIAWLLFERMEIERDMGSVVGKAVDSDSYRELMERYLDTEAARLAREIYGGEIEEKEVVRLPEEYRLREPYPNPFNSSVVIGFDLPEAGKVELRIYDVLGREVYREIKEYAAGEYSIIWDGRSSKGLEVPSGVYIVVTKAGRYVGVKKVVLMR